MYNGTGIRTLVGPGHEWNAWLHGVQFVGGNSWTSASLACAEDSFCAGRFRQGEDPVCASKTGILKKESCHLLPSSDLFEKPSASLLFRTWKMERERMAERASLPSPASHTNRPRSPRAAETSTEPSALTNQSPRVRTPHGTCSSWNAVRFLGILGKRQA